MSDNERHGKTPAQPPRKPPEDWGEIEGVKPPVIRIKKDGVVDSDSELHYNREKRLAMGSARKPTPIMGFFRTFLGFGFRGSSRRGRGRFSPLLPVLVIAIAVVFVVKFSGRSPSPAGIAGYGAVLRADPFESSLLVSVSFTPPAKAPAVPQSATVRFQLPDTKEELIVSGELSGDAPAIRAKMHYTGKEKTITAEVRIGDQVKTLSASIRRPSG